MCFSSSVLYFAHLNPFDEVACSYYRAFSATGGRCIPLLLALFLYALRAAHEVVDQRAYEGNQQDKERPGDFIVALRGLFRETVNQDPEPEDRREDGYTLSPFQEKGQ